MRRDRKKRRALRVRVKVKRGDSPKVSVFRSNKYIWASLIKQAKGEVIATCSSKNLANFRGTKTQAAHRVGLLLAELSKKKKITHVVFDRGAYKYHGRVKALAQGLREGGLVL